MRVNIRHLVCASVCVIGAVVAVEHPIAQGTTNPTAAAVAEFNRRVSAYMDLHKKAEAAAPDVTKGATPAEVLVFEEALAGRIRAARSSAKQGDVFVPDVTPVFKKTFSDYYQRRSGREIRLLFDEVPNFKPQVNMTYPVNAPKATFPPRLALSLPQLPEELEYRLVGTSLVLRDSEANLIVDYIPNVLPATAKPGSRK
jgi:hypothetical protein